MTKDNPRWKEDRVSSSFFAVNQKGKTSCKRDYIKQVKNICFVVAQLEEARFEEGNSI